MAGSHSDDQTVLSDLTYRPPSGVFNAKPPRQLLNQIHWVRCLITSTVSTSTTAATESNTTYSASNHLQGYASYLAVFDQYYLQSVVYTVSNLSTTSGGTTCYVYTAIDYDNTNNVGSALLGYATCVGSALAPGESVTRVLYPCNAGYLGTSASAGVTRTWVDSALSSVPFYGSRLLSYSTPAVVLLEVTISSTWALRSNI
jgi:hypothetical protein